MKKLWTGIVAVGLLTSCQQVKGWLGIGNGTDSTHSLTSESMHKAKMLRDESITAENAYSDLFLDSAVIENYITREKIAADKADQMRAFYLVRSNQFAWFTSEGVTEQARGLWGLYESKADSVEREPTARLKDRMDSLLTQDSAFLAMRDSAAMAAGDTVMIGEMPTTIMRADSTLIHTELALTAQFVDLMTGNNGTITADNFFWMVPRKRMDAMQMADSLLHKGQDSALWQDNTQYAALKNSLNTYYEATRNGGWQTITALPVPNQGTRSAAVVQLKKRLAATGDYTASDTSNLYSDSLAVAIRAVQEQFGLMPTGQISDSLIHELNVPAEQRMQQILVNMNRALWLPPHSDSSRVVVNIPSQELVVYSDNNKVMTMPVIVGKEGSGTMAFNDRITTVVFNPYWYIPRSIVQNEIMPAMKKDPNYLKSRNMEIVKQNDSIPEIRQLPGKDNSMGQVKFLFPNTFDIYLHDTPNKMLFTQRDRALSHGCIRVAEPDSLAYYVLRGQAEWTPEKIAAAMSNGNEQQVTVNNPVPVSITYYTAWMGANGKLQFRKDIYGYDTKTADRMFTTTSQPATTASPA